MEPNQIKRERNPFFLCIFYELTPVYFLWSVQRLSASGWYRLGGTPRCRWAGDSPRQVGQSPPRVGSQLAGAELHTHRQATSISSVPDPDPPDPHVFGPPGSTSQRNGSGSESFYHQAKIVRKLWFLLSDFFRLLIFEKWSKSTFKK